MIEKIINVVVCDWKKIDVMISSYLNDKAQDPDKSALGSIL